jgi:hypothetical protein
MMVLAGWEGSTSESKLWALGQKAVELEPFRFQKESIFLEMRTAAPIISYATWRSKISLETVGRRKPKATE